MVFTIVTYYTHYKRKIRTDSSFNSITKGVALSANLRLLMDMFELYKTFIGEVVGRYSELCLYACVFRDVILLQCLYNWTTYRHPSTRMYPLRTNHVGPSTQIVWTALTSKIPPGSFAPPSCWREQDGRLPKCKGPRHSPTWPCYAWVDSSFRHVEQDRCGSDALNFEPWWNTVWWRLKVFF